MDEPSRLHFPKRVVLLFKMDETDQDIVHAFLRYSGRPKSEYLTRRHAVHLDPGRHEHESDTYLAHLVIDMEANDLQDPDLASLAHEIYKVTHDMDKRMCVSRGPPSCLSTLLAV
jgi:hypothetical protein